MDKYYMSEPMKYWAMPSSMSPAARKIKLEAMSASGDYVVGEKTDGNWSRAVITDEHKALQTRGISKSTHEYGRIEEKVLFWDNIVHAFPNGDTIILGEVFLPGKIDKDIGSILRCLKDKALARQKDEPLRWRIFDVLALDGEDLMNKPVVERISHIKEVVTRINSPLVEGVEYFEMDDTFFDRLGEVFSRGGEGLVCYRKSAPYIPGKRGPSAWDSCKVKQEIQDTIDCVIMDLIPAEHYYNGKEIETWQYWEDNLTGERLLGQYYIQYLENKGISPISKNYYYKFPGAIMVGVYDKSGNLVPLCKVAGLTDEFKTSLRDSFITRWKGTPVSISGMMVSTAKADESGVGISIRHPILKAIRENDLEASDCTLEKILS